jgi:hypothetical protein
MWIISKNGFVSLVQHNADSTKLRARARRREHLAATFPDTDIEDLGVNAPDYRWHCDVDRAAAASLMAQTVMDIDYTSHVKEAVTQGDHDFYSSMMGAWRELNRMQDRGIPKRNYRGYDGGSASQDKLWPDDDDDWRSRFPNMATRVEKPTPTIGSLAGDIAARMTAVPDLGDPEPADYGVEWEDHDDDATEIRSTDDKFTLRLVNGRFGAEWTMECADETEILDGFEDLMDAMGFVDDYLEGDVPWA